MAGRRGVPCAVWGATRSRALLRETLAARQHRRNARSKSKVAATVTTNSNNKRKVYSRGPKTHSSVGSGNTSTAKKTTTRAKDESSMITKKGAAAASSFLAFSVAAEWHGTTKFNDDTVAQQLQEAKSVPRAKSSAPSKKGEYIDNKKEAKRPQSR